LRMPNSTTQIATTAAPTAIAKSSRSTWYQVPANGRSTRMKSTCWPPSRRRRGPGRLLQQPLPVPKGRLCGGLCLRLEHTVPHLPARQKAGRLLLIRCAPYASTGSRPVLNTEPTPTRPTADGHPTAQPSPCGTDADGLRPAPPDSGCPPDGAGPLCGGGVNPPPSRPGDTGPPGPAKADGTGRLAMTSTTKNTTTAVRPVQRGHQVAVQFSTHAPQ